MLIKTSHSLNGMICVNDQLPDNQSFITGTGFEGPEKLLEIWFFSSPATIPSGCRSLKSISRQNWQNILDLVNCKILSVIHSNKVDAYLLSESSMFVYSHKIIVKTCGSTTLLNGLIPILEQAALTAMFPSEPIIFNDTLYEAVAVPYRVFYSRKNFFFPDQQRTLHRSWQNECQFLDDLFLDGSAYLLGKTNSEHWYLYMTGPNVKFTKSMNPRPINNTSHLSAPVLPLCSLAAALPESDSHDISDLDSEVFGDQTLEILMTGLNPKNLAIFDFPESGKIESLCETVARNNPEIGLRAYEAMKACEASSRHTDPIVHSKCQVETAGHRIGKFVAQFCKFDEIFDTQYPSQIVLDSYTFSPRGFSVNGIITSNMALPLDEPDAAINPPKTVCDVCAKARQVKSTQSHYLTVHVTPEQPSSYASFETNYPFTLSHTSLCSVIKRVIKIFLPERFSITYFRSSLENVPKCNCCACKTSLSSSIENDSELKDNFISPGYQRLDYVFQKFDDYDLIFAHFKRPNDIHQ